jgi:hypothetical protein
MPEAANRKTPILRHSTHMSAIAFASHTPVGGATLRSSLCFAQRLAPLLRVPVDNRQSSGVFLGGCIPPYRQVVHSAAAGCLSICVTASALARSANWLSFASRPGQPGLARHETRHGRRVAVRKARSCVVVGLFCVTTVSIVCTFKAPVPDRAGDGLDPSISMVAGPAGGADGVVGSVLRLVLADGRYFDGPRSQAPLAAEDDLNPKRAKRGLCARRSRPASARGTLWPTRPKPRAAVRSADDGSMRTLFADRCANGQPWKPLIAITGATAACVARFLINLPHLALFCQIRTHK